MSSNDRELINALLRMVAPMRREFGYVLKVQHFLHDLDYAQDVLKKAYGSQDALLCEHAQYVGKLLLGPRLGEPSQDSTSTTPKAASKPLTDTSSSLAKQGSQASELTEQELLARIKMKYTSGLR